MRPLRYSGSGDAAGPAGPAHLVVPSLPTSTERSVLIPKDVTVVQGRTYGPWPPTTHGKRHRSRDHGVEPSRTVGLGLCHRFHGASSPTRRVASLRVIRDGTAVVLSGAESTTP